MNNIILCNLGQDRRKGNGAKVLVDVLDKSLFGDRDDIILLLSKIRGSQPSQKEIFMISMMGGGGFKRSVFSFKSHPEILSGPCALAGLTEHDFFKARNCD